MNNPQKTPYTPGDTVEIRVPRHLDGVRLDQCLAASFPGYSRVFFQRCLRDTTPTLNNEPCRQSDRVYTNDLIRFAWPQPEVSAKLAPENVEFRILAEDDAIIVVDKPSGLVVHPTRNYMNATLVHGLLYHDAERFEQMIDADLRPGIVHRLDKDTSGVMVVAKTASAWTCLKRAFAERTVEKCYLALVMGEFGVVTGELSSQIGRHPVARQKMAVVADGGKPALTRYRVLGTAQNVSFVQVQILTGRTHQIRVHFAHMNHAVLGDLVYGGRQKDAPVHAARQMLHSWRLAFPHPETGVVREYMAPVPADFQALLADLGLERTLGRQG